MYGITENGFNRKTYTDIIADMEAQAKVLFGEDIDLSERNPLSKTLQNIGWEISTLWELAEDVYNSAFIDTSENTSLEGVGKYIGIPRKTARPSKGEITIKGKAGTRVPSGFRVSTENDGLIFATTKESTISETGEVSVPVESINVGLYTNTPAMTLVKIVNPSSGVGSVFNSEPTLDGLDVESDKDFRERYYRSISLGGSSTRESVEATLLNIPDVTDAFVEENSTINTVGDVPPKSLASYVFGGTDDEIGLAILSSKAGGIRAYGDTVVEVEDSKGITHSIGFTRPAVKDVYVKLAIKKDKGYPGDGVVVSSILEYIGGTDVNAYAYKGLKLGEPVVISKLLSSAMCLEGISDISVTVSLDNVSYTNENIILGKKEIARTSHDKVVISYV